MVLFIFFRKQRTPPKRGPGPVMVILREPSRIFVYPLPLISRVLSTMKYS